MQNKAVISKKGNHTIVKFDKEPLPKVKKRLRDFKFRYNYNDCSWRGNVENPFRIFCYLLKNTDIDVSWTK